MTDLYIAKKREKISKQDCFEYVYNLIYIYQSTLKYEKIFPCKEERIKENK